MEPPPPGPSDTSSSPSSSTRGLETGSLLPGRLRDVEGTPTLPGWDGVGRRTTGVQGDDESRVRGHSRGLLPHTPGGHLCNIPRDSYVRRGSTSSTALENFLWVPKNTVLEDLGTQGLRDKSVRTGFTKKVRPAQGDP